MTNVTLDDILTVVNFFVQKSDTPIKVSKEYFNALIEMANLDYLDYRYSKWDESRDESDDLRVLKDTDVDEDISSGTWTLPVGAEVRFYRLSSVRVHDGSNNYVPCDIVTDMELQERQTDSLTQPSGDYPVCVVSPTVLTFYSGSDSLVEADITYLKYPSTPFYDLKPDNGINVYDSDGSKEFDWPDSCAPDLIRLILGYMDIVVDKRLVLEQIKKVEGDS